MARLPPDCAICCEPLTKNLAAPSRCGHVYHIKCLKKWLHSSTGSYQRRCPICRGSCRSSEVVGLCFDLAKPPEDLEVLDEERPGVLKMRLSMAQANLTALMDAEDARQRECNVLKGRVTSLEGKLQVHVERTSEAEARAARYRSRLVTTQASRDRLSAELQKIRKELKLQTTRKEYLTEARTMSQTRAVEFLHEKSGEDLNEALRMQHNAICELQSEISQLKSEHMKQKTNLKAEIQRKDVVIQRLRSNEETRRPTTQQSESHQQQVSTKRRGAPNGVGGSKNTKQATEAGRTKSALPRTTDRCTNTTPRRNVPKTSVDASSSSRSARSTAGGRVEYAVRPLPPRSSTTACVPVANARSTQIRRLEELAPNRRTTQTIPLDAPVQGIFSGCGSGELGERRTSWWSRYFNFVPIAPVLASAVATMGVFLAATRLLNKKASR